MKAPNKNTKTIYIFALGVLFLLWSLPAMGGDTWLDAHGLRIDNVNLNGSHVTNTTYWIDPPFLSTKVPPNVLIVLDSSGSMNDQAYASTYNPSQFVSGNYYGYFDPASLYIYSSSRWQVTTQLITSGTTSSPIASGNFLNWATMRRIDAAKKLLVGGKANPRSMSSGCCVKLNGESSSSSWDFFKDFDNSSTPNLIYPFVGDYSYSMSGAALTISPNFSATSPTVRPSADLSIPAEWTVTGTGSAYDAVDEATANGDTNYIQNKTDVSAAMFDYSYGGSRLGTITSIGVYINAKKVQTANKTMRFQGVLRVNGVEYPAGYQSLSTSYSTYTFNWTNNPATGLAWSWDDINAGTSTNILNGFGVQANTNPLASCYPRVTQIYIVINVTTASGGPYSIVVDTGTADISGIIDNLSGDARFGLAFYNNGQGIEAGTSNGRYDGGYVDTYIDFGTPTSMITSIGNMSPSTWTPLAETLFEMVKYFRQDAPYYSGNSPADYTVGQNYDPYYYQYSKVTGSGLADQYVPCPKSFILLLTDGESTMDQNIPAAYRDYDNDGKDGVSYASKGTDYLDDVAYWARTTDQRGDLSGTQNIITYSVFMFGKGSQLLKDTAINGGFDDLNGDNKPSCIYPAVPGNPTQDELKECYRPSVSSGTIDPATDLPLTYYEGDDGYELQSSIIDAITAILKRAASGTSVSVLGSSWKGEGAIYQAYFYPEKVENLRTVKWTGYFRALFVDRSGLIHEDTNGDGQLTPSNDKVVNFVFTAGQDTQAQLFWDKVKNSTGTSVPDGLTDTSTPLSTVKIGDIKPIWDAGLLLAARNPADRTIYSTTDNTNLISFDPATAASVAALRPFVRGKTNTDAQNLMRFIRGEQLSGWRDRQLTASGSSALPGSTCVSDLCTWKLSDIVFSDPVVVAAPKERFDLIYGSSSYAGYYKHWKNRRAVVYVGSNGGMLHAFNGGFPVSAPDTPNMNANITQVTFCTALNADGTCGSDSTTPLGKELWAFIPYDVLPHLAWLADPDYVHVYYDDLMTRVTDARIFTADADHVNGWGTVLIVGLRFGGGEIDVTDDFGSGVATTRQFKSAYYCLDVTNPEASPKLLWRFTDDELGFTTGVPTIVREDIDTNKENSNESWYAVFGSGPSNYRGGRVVDSDTTNTKFTKSGVVSGLSGMATTNAYIYAIDLKTGLPVSTWTAHSTSGRKGVIKLSETSALTANMTAADLPLDFRYDMIYAGSTFCASGCAADGSGTWSGNMYRIKTNLSTDPGTWALSTLYSPLRPITAKPSAGLDTRGNVWVYFGTGRYLHIDDRFDSAIQSFYGVKDPCYYSGCTTTVSAANLLDATNLNVLTNGNLYPSLAAGTMPGQTMAINDFRTLSNFMKDTGEGWHLTLDAQERITVNGFVVGGIAGFGSYTPTNDVCEFEGSSKQYFPYYLTGTADYFPQGSAAPTYTSGGGLAYSKSVDSGSGLPSAPAVHVDSKGNTKLFIQQSTGAISVIQLPTATSVTGGLGSGSESPN